MLRYGRTNCIGRHMEGTCSAVHSLVGCRVTVKMTSDGQQLTDSALLSDFSDPQVPFSQLSIDFVEAPDQSKSLGPTRFCEDFKNFENLSERRLGTGLKAVVRKD
jgi:hypothetical protein